jgi:hypothetical protein
MNLSEYKPCACDGGDDRRDNGDTAAGLDGCDDARSVVVFITTRQGVPNGSVEDRVQPFVVLGIFNAGVDVRRADAAMQTARAFATGERGEIQIGYAPSLTVEVLPQALRAFEKQCPRVRVSLHDLSVQEMLRSLLEGRLDAALTIESSAKAMRGLAFAKLRTYSVCVAVSRAHRLARAKRVERGP